MARASWKLYQCQGSTRSVIVVCGLSKAWLLPEMLSPSGELGEPHSLEVMVQPALPSKARFGGAPVGPVWAETTRYHHGTCDVGQTPKECTLLGTGALLAHRSPGAQEKLGTPGTEGVGSRGKVVVIFSLPSASHPVRAQDQALIVV